LPVIVLGMGPIRGSVGANGFRIRTATSPGDTINNVTANSYTNYAIIPANSQYTCTPTSATNWSVETLSLEGVRAAATMV